MIPTSASIIITPIDDGAMLECQREIVIGGERVTICARLPNQDWALTQLERAVTERAILLLQGHLQALEQAASPPRSGAVCQAPKNG